VRRKDWFIEEEERGREWGLTQPLTQELPPWRGVLSDAFNRGVRCARAARREEVAS
jgi:hypothetical protein